MEFSNDGIRDSLTGVMAPQLFYESAERLISWSRRRDEATSIIVADTSPLDEDSMTNLARELAAELRGGDLLSRLGIWNLVFFIVGDERAAAQLIFRLENSVKPKVSYRSVTFHQGEELISALSRLGI
jgi:GGDEF domain-containing protein